MKIDILSIHLENFPEVHNVRKKTELFTCDIIFNSYLKVLINSFFDKFLFVFERLI